MSDAKIEDILGKMEELIEYDFSYKGDLFINEKRRSINLQDKSLESALVVLLGNKFDYKVLNNTIIIKKNKNYKPKRVKKYSNNKNKIKKNPPRKVDPIQLLTSYELKNIHFVIDSPNIEKEIIYTVSLDTTKKRKIVKIGYIISPLVNLQMHSKKKMGISTGVALDFLLFRNLYLSSGFSFQKQKLQNNNFDINQLDNCNIADLTESLPRSYQSDLYMIDMSILLRYDIIKGANVYFLTAGLSNTYVNIKYDYYYNEKKVKYGTYYKLGLFNMINLSCGFEGKITAMNSFSYQIEPFFKYSLTNYSPEKIKLAYLGLSFRVNYYLRNR